MSDISIVDYVLAIPEEEPQQISYHSPYGKYHIIFYPRKEDKMEYVNIYLNKSGEKLFTFSIADFIEVIWGYEKVAIVCYLGTWICCLKTGNNFRLPISGSRIEFVASFSPNSELFAFLNRLNSLQILNLKTNEILFSYQICNQIEKLKWCDHVVLHFQYEDGTTNDINLLGVFGKIYLAMLIVQKRRLSVRLPHELCAMIVYDFFT